MDFRGQTEPNRAFGVVSDGRAPLRRPLTFPVSQEEGSTAVQSLNRGWYRGFLTKIRPRQSLISLSGIFCSTQTNYEKTKVRIIPCSRTPPFPFPAFSPAAT